MYEGTSWHLSWIWKSFFLFCFLKYFKMNWCKYFIKWWNSATKNLVRDSFLKGRADKEEERVRQNRRERASERERHNREEWDLPSSSESLPKRLPTHTSGARRHRRQELHPGLPKYPNILGICYCLPRWNSRKLLLSRTQPGLKSSHINNVGFLSIGLTLCATRTALLAFPWWMWSFTSLLQS